MKRATWTAGMLAAFAVGMIVSATASRARADTAPLPAWVKPGACLIVNGGGGSEVVLEVQAPWARTSRGDLRVVGPEQWRNLAVAQWIQRQPDANCRAARR